MPRFPPGASPNLLSLIPTDTLLDWIEDPDANRPNVNSFRDPDRSLLKYGCTIVQDHNVSHKHSHFKKGMTGQWLEESSGEVRVYFRGVSEWWDSDGVKHQDQWVPAEIVERGTLWRNNVKDWNYRLNLDRGALERLERYRIEKQLKPNTKSPDASVLGKTIAGLLHYFQENPAPFMGSKIDLLLDKRRSLGKGNDMDSVVQVIIEGIKKAGLYNTLNHLDFNVDQIFAASTMKIDEELDRGKAGGVYLRLHRSKTSVTRWRVNKKYAYVGKTVDFRERYDAHPYSKSRYGDLTRNSYYKSLALCEMSSSDNVDFAYLVEQIFVCLLETYREDVIISAGGVVELHSKSATRHAEEVDAALYFRKASAKVFADTKFPGGTSRPTFLMSFGANYSSPFKEWSLMTEQRLFLRYDTIVKNADGSVMPISVFRSAKPKIAQYFKKTGKTAKELHIFSKMDRGKYFFGFSHTQDVHDGKFGPKQGQAYYIVFEVRTDGGAHPKAWSRLPEIGPFNNWQQGRALAARIEWEYPERQSPPSFRYRYIQTRKIFTFIGPNEPAPTKPPPSWRSTNINYYRSIAMTQWLFDARPGNNSQGWMKPLRGCAYVLQTVYDYRTQTVEIKLPEPLTMKPGFTILPGQVVQQMQSKGLGYVNQDKPPEMDKRLNCDTCALMRTERQESFTPNGCERLTFEVNEVVFITCRVCNAFGRPCCSWTPGPGFKNPGYYTVGQISGKNKSKAQISSDEVQVNQEYLSLLVTQPRVEEQTHEEFRQQLFDARTALSMKDLNDDLNDDLSDTEPSPEDTVVDEGVDDYD